jgi:hypothetical protein
MVIVPESASKHACVLDLKGGETTRIHAIDIGNRHDDVDEFAAHSHKSSMNAGQIQSLW